MALFLFQLLLHEQLRQHSPEYGYVVRIDGHQQLVRHHGRICFRNKRLDASLLHVFLSYDLGEISASTESGVSSVYDFDDAFVTRSL